MKVIFRTNLDEAQICQWPELDFPPSVGDSVRAVRPFHKCKHFELKVTGRTFVQYEGQESECICELHLNPHIWINISEFEAWVQRMKYGA